MTQAFCDGSEIWMTKQSVIFFNKKVIIYCMKEAGIKTNNSAFQFIFSPWNFGVLNITKNLSLVNPGTLTTPQRKNANLKNK